MASLTRHIFTGGIANLLVGKDEVPFDAHIELLCACSPFFDNALHGRFVEAETKMIPLPDDDPDTFTEFLSWMYNRRIFADNTKPGWLELSRLWVMADKYQVPELQNNVMELFPTKFEAMKCKGNVHPIVLDFVYDNTTADSPLRKMIVDICTWGMDVDKFEQHRKDMPTEFLEDFGLQQMRKNALGNEKAPFETFPPRYFVKTSKKSEKPYSKPFVKNSGDTEVHDGLEFTLLTPSPHTPPTPSSRRRNKNYRPPVRLPQSSPKSGSSAGALTPRSPSSSSQSVTQGSVNAVSTSLIGLSL
ncbi:hypothetical protein K469DRAFT_752393 [Zopfia rhizophila CBS 207.26]|uniref:BTB domain-containing protein n=1 Tax=Zopfia rhizophila CBS 207.26 TaxID=1314779 RepID=A0A6A6DUN7_9PEZI|nr:hypothetical protein K469DRAFT_752393 [Zopfia rhizophila CBS 207.26]